MGFKLRSTSVINDNKKDLHLASLALKDPAPSKFTQIEMIHQAAQNRNWGQKESKTQVNSNS